MALFCSYSWLSNIPLLHDSSAWTQCIIAVGVNGMRVHKRQCDSGSDDVDGRKDSEGSINDVVKDYICLVMFCL